MTHSGPAATKACTGARFLLFFTCALAAARAQQHADIAITPLPVVAGSPQLVQVAAPRAAIVEGEWLGHKLQFFRGAGSRGWLALAGVDLDAPIGPSTLTVHVRDSDGATRDLSRTIDVGPAHYKTETLDVAPEFVEPGPEALRQIEVERQLKDKVFAQSAPRPLWRGSFRAPIPLRPTDSFGVRRMFNGKLASVHQGADFRAKTGTPVRAANSGAVVLARALYYEGNCVVIDHGLGLFTLSMHLSRIDVHEGARIAKGQRLGLSGATGRATGPHLHWAVRWQGVYLDPVKLLHMNLGTDTSGQRAGRAGNSQRGPAARRR